MIHHSFNLVIVIKIFKIKMKKYNKNKKNKEIVL